MSTSNLTIDLNEMTLNIGLKLKWHDVIILILYGLIFVLGIAGNSLVVFVVAKTKSMRTVTNLFIANMALSDIMTCLLSIPFTWISIKYQEWKFGAVMCSLVPFSLGTSVYVSTLTSMSIAIDRYFVIVHPFRTRMKLGITLLVIVIIWIVSISVSLPLAIYQKYNSSEDGIGECGEMWPENYLKVSFDVSSLILQYLVPFAVIAYSYIRVWIVLSKRTRPNQCKEKEQIELRRKVKTNRMLVAMVAIFAGCWMPLNITHLIIGIYKQSHFINNTIFTIAHLIAMSSTCYNPFLYAWLNENFRKEFRLVLPFLFKAVEKFKSIRYERSHIAIHDEMTHGVHHAHFELTTMKLKLVEEIANVEACQDVQEKRTKVTTEL